MGKLKEVGQEWLEFWKFSPWSVSVAAIVFLGFFLFLLVGVPNLVMGHIKLTEQCEAKSGVVLKTPDGWACFEDKVRVKN